MDIFKKILTTFCILIILLFFFNKKENFNNIKFVKINSHGATSDMYISKDKKYIKKVVNKYKEYDVVKREIYILKLLNKHNYKWVPKIISFNNNEIVSTYCGEEVNSDNIPHDYLTQINSILIDLKKHKIKHNDIKINEILIKDNKIHLCDFGWASINDDFSLGINISKIKKPYRIIKDSNIINTLDKIFKKKKHNLYRKESFVGNNNYNKELHIIIDWKQKYKKDYIFKKIKDNKLSLHKFIEHKKLNDKATIMSKFYNMSVDDFRGETTFNIYLLNDYNPIYKLRNTSKGKRLVNTKIFDLKKTLRNNDYSIHGTDNIQETKDNLVDLNLFDKYYEQKRFDSLSHVFEVLNNNSELKWVVMRNFEDMPNNIHIDEHLDVDLLVNDYYLVKRLLDASSATNNRFEDGKHRILNHVIINNKKVLFDFRCIGDNYYDINFQKNMLDTRVKYKNFYIPNKLNHLYGLIYHAIIHKNKISNSYKKIFTTNNISCDKNNLKKLLDNFMNNNNYKYVKPELSVGFNFNSKMR